jgi:hypothetical protein
LLITFGTVTFDEFLIAKRIDGRAFRQAEPQVFDAWKNEFQQMHVNSFTVQKLNLINPIRRKFHLNEPVKPDVDVTPAAPTAKPVAPRIAKPMMKPKPKTDENV